MDFLITLGFLDGKKSHVLCKNSSVQKTVSDGLSKTLVGPLPYGTVWVDKPSRFVVVGVANVSLRTSLSRITWYPVHRYYRQTTTKSSGVAVTRSLLVVSNSVHSL